MEDLNEIYVSDSAIEEFNEIWLVSNSQSSQPLAVEPEENNNTTFVELNSLSLSDVSDGLSQYLLPFPSSNEEQVQVIERIEDNSLLDLQFGMSPVLNETSFNSIPEQHIKAEYVPMINVGPGVSTSVFVPPLNIHSGVSSTSLSTPLEFTESHSNSQPVESTTPSVQSSLPASQDWSGDYGFNVSFPPQEKNTKSVSWTYSQVLNKLYVCKDAPCPISFSTNAVMPEDVTIRVMPLYSCPESSSEVVTRCISHSLEEKSQNIPEAEHLVRCESSSAIYEVDVSTNRQSVVVPFDNPSVGQENSTYIYKFTCFGSCRFGPNRRPLMLVFTLENRNHVIGRQKVYVKICSSPGRDRRSDEKPSTSCEGGTSKKRRQPELELLSGTLDFAQVSIPNPPCKKAKGQEGQYQINAESDGMYEFLVQMKTLYTICETMRSLPRDVKKELAKHCERKGHPVGSKKKQRK